MIRYLTLLKFTDQGAQNVDKSVQRASDFGKSVSDAGGKLVLQVCYDNQEFEMVLKAVS